jgi:hypothetical protein
VQFRTGDDEVFGPARGLKAFFISVVKTTMSAGVEANTRADFFLARFNLNFLGAMQWISKLR